MRFCIICVCGIAVFFLEACNLHQRDENHHSRSYVGDNVPRILESVPLTPPKINCAQITLVHVLNGQIAPNGIGSISIPNTPESQAIIDNRPDITIGNTQIKGNGMRCLIIRRNGLSNIPNFDIDVELQTLSVHEYTNGKKESDPEYNVTALPNNQKISIKRSSLNNGPLGTAHWEWLGGFFSQGSNEDVKKTENSTHIVESLWIRIELETRNEVPVTGGR